MMRVNTHLLKWIATDITIGSGSVFHIHMIASSSTANYDDFYFVGETKSLTDGTTVKSFGNTVGFIMKSKINMQDAKNIIYLYIRYLYEQPIEQQNNKTILDKLS